MTSKIPKSHVQRIVEMLGELSVIGVFACSVIAAYMIAFHFDDPELHRRGIGLAMIALLSRGRS